MWWCKYKWSGEKRAVEVKEQWCNLEYQLYWKIVWFWYFFRNDLKHYHFDNGSWDAQVRDCKNLVRIIFDPPLWNHISQELPWGNAEWTLHYVESLMMEKVVSRSGRSPFFLLFTIMSSMYTSIVHPIWLWNILVTRRWKVAPAFLWPKGIIL